MAHADPKPYELELATVDSCKPDDVLIAAAGGDVRHKIRLRSRARRKRMVADAGENVSIRPLVSFVLLEQATGIEWIAENYLNHALEGYEALDDRFEHLAYA